MYSQAVEQIIDTLEEQLLTDWQLEQYAELGVELIQKMVIYFSLIIWITVQSTAQQIGIITRLF